MDGTEIENEEEIDLEDILALDAIEPLDAANIARDITVAWIQGNKYEDNLSEEEVAAFYKAVYQATRFPTLVDEDEGLDLEEAELAEAEA